MAELVFGTVFNTHMCRKRLTKRQKFKKNEISDRRSKRCAEKNMIIWLRSPDGVLLSYLLTCNDEPLQPCSVLVIFIFTRDSCTGRYCWERVLAMAILSVRLSVCPSVWGVTTRYRIEPRSDRDTRFSPYDSLGSLVSNEVIVVPLGEEIPLERGNQRGVPLLEIVIVPLLAHLAWKRLQINTDLLLIITTTADVLSSGTNIDDLELPWTPKIWVLTAFSLF